MSEFLLQKCQLLSDTAVTAHSLHIDQLHSRTRFSARNFYYSTQGGATITAEVLAQQTKDVSRNIEISPRSFHYRVFKKNVLLGSLFKEKYDHVPQTVYSLHEVITLFLGGICFFPPRIIKDYCNHFNKNNTSFEEKRRKKDEEVNTLPRLPFLPNEKKKRKKAAELPGLAVVGFSETG